MKRILVLIIVLITTQTTQSQTVVLDANGVTVKWTGNTVPSPYFVQANPRGTGMEWFAIVDNSTKSNITNYAKNIQSGITFFTPPSGTAPIPFNNIVTTLVTDMSQVFFMASSFNQPIISWDVSNVNYMEAMFQSATIFNQPISSWNVSNVINMGGMFNSASSFNQPISTWNVSNVNYMAFMFAYTTAFNQPISAWNVGNVTQMQGMFFVANSFNQQIDSWNVINVTNMRDMFHSATAFNQNISSWNVGNVTDMGYMFSGATNFNQPIFSWNVSNVTDMNSMFQFTAFNQNISFWNVGNVTNMTSMFTGAQLSTTNYDATLIGWATITAPEIPLKPNVVFNAGNSKYCNGASARSSIISTYGWTITDGGQDCSSLDADEFDTNNIKLYPNPVVNILNIKVENNLIYQTYSIIDGLGRVVLNGKLNDFDTTINVEKLSKGIYYLKIAKNIAIKFIRE